MREKNLVKKGQAVSDIPYADLRYTALYGAGFLNSILCRDILVERCLY